MLTHEQSLWTYESWCDVVGLNEDDRYLVVNPFFHTFGYKAGWMACLMRGATTLPVAVFDVDTVMQDADPEYHRANKASMLTAGQVAAKIVEMIYGDNYASGQSVDI